VYAGRNFNVWFKWCLCCHNVTRLRSWGNNEFGGHNLTTRNIVEPSKRWSGQRHRCSVHNASHQATAANPLINLLRITSILILYLLFNPLHAVAVFKKLEYPQVPPLLTYENTLIRRVNARTCRYGLIKNEIDQTTKDDIRNKAIIR